VTLLTAAECRNKAEQKMVEAMNAADSRQHHELEATAKAWLELADKIEQAESTGSAEGEGKMSAARLQELEEMAARLLALARKLPPGQRRYDIMQEIGRFRVQIAALKGPELGRSHRGPKAKEK
jgi:hypothetical protein